MNMMIKLSNETEQKNKYVWCNSSVLFFQQDMC